MLCRAATRWCFKAILTPTRRPTRLTEDSIMAHLNMLQQVDQDWTNALVSGSKEALEAYLQKYPNSPHKQEVSNEINSIDWQMALKDNTVDGYQAYLDAHADGSHIEEAEEALQKIKSSEVQPEESQVISGLFRQFFQSINSRNEDGSDSYLRGHPLLTPRQDFCHQVGRCHLHAQALQGRCEQHELAS